MVDELNMADEVTRRLLELERPEHPLQVQLRVAHRRRVVEPGPVSDAGFDEALARVHERRRLEMKAYARRKAAQRKEMVS